MSNSKRKFEWEKSQASDCKPRIWPHHRCHKHEPINLWLQSTPGATVLESARISKTKITRYRKTEKQRLKRQMNEWVEKKNKWEVQTNRQCREWSLRMSTATAFNVFTAIFFLEFGIFYPNQFEKREKMEESREKNEGWRVDGEESD